MRPAFLLCMLFLAACGGEEDEWGSNSCSPAPAITSSPSRTASVGAQYRYDVDWTLDCIPLFTSCGFRLVSGPGGAGVDRNRGAVYWTPQPGDAGRVVQFTISTDADLCGDRASQSWSVTVFP